MATTLPEATIAYHYGGNKHNSWLVSWDDAMTLRTKLVFALSLPFIGFFAFGVTGIGQRVLIGKLPQNVDYWKADDVYMGAGSSGRPRLRASSLFFSSECNPANARQTA